MTVRRQLLALGVPARRVPLATPYMFFAPMTVDSRAAGVREIVCGLQRRLRDIGFLVRVSGAIDVATTRALDRMVPPSGSFAARSFSELASLLLAAHGVSHAALSGAGWEHGRDKTNCVGLGPTKKAFVHLQRGINRLATKLGTPRVKADGIIGATTVSVAKKISNRIYDPPSPLWHSATCETLANQASNIGKSFHEKADALGAPKKPRRPKSKPIPGLELPIAANAGGSANTLLKFAPYLLLAGGVAFVVVTMRGRT